MPEVREDEYKLVDVDLARLQIVDAVPVDANWGGRTPTVAIAFEISVISGNSVDVDVIGFERRDSLTAETFATFLAYVANPNQNLMHPFSIRPKYGSTMSFRCGGTSANPYPELVYFIIKIRHRKIQFDRTAKPFSVPSVFSGNFGNARIVDVNGVAHSTGPTDGCRTAFMIVDGAGFTASQLDGGIPFNLHFDAESKKHDGTSGSPSHIQIIVDPDIRYPGGNGP